MLAVAVTVAPRIMAASVGSRAAATVSVVMAIAACACRAFVDAEAHSDPSARRVEIDLMWRTMDATRQELSELRSAHAALAARHDEAASALRTLAVAHGALQDRHAALEAKHSALHDTQASLLQARVLGTDGSSHTAGSSGGNEALPAWYPVTPAGGGRVASRTGDRGGGDISPALGSRSAESRWSSTSHRRLGAGQPTEGGLGDNDLIVMSADNHLGEAALILNAAKARLQLGSPAANASLDVDQWGSSNLRCNVNGTLVASIGSDGVVAQHVEADPVAFTVRSNEHDGLFVPVAFDQGALEWATGQDAEFELAGRWNGGLVEHLAMSFRGPGRDSDEGSDAAELSFAHVQRFAIVDGATTERRTVAHWVLHPHGSTMVVWLRSGGAGASYTVKSLGGRVRVRGLVTSGDVVESTTDIPSITVATDPGEDWATSVEFAAMATVSSLASASLVPQLSAVVVSELLAGAQLVPASRSPRELISFDMDRDSVLLSGVTQGEVGSLAAGTISGGAAFGGANNGIAVIGDNNGDGITDMAVVRPVNSGSGSVVILMMNADASVGGQSSISLTEGNFAEASDGAVDDDDNWATRIAAMRDWDNDGLKELVVGQDRQSGAQRGAVWVLLLNAGGTVKAASFLGNGNDGGYPVGLQTEHGWFGIGIVCADLDSDEVDEIVVGAYKTAVNGAVFVTFVAPHAETGLPAYLRHIEISNNQPSSGWTMPSPPYAETRFGTSLAALEVDGDGVVDLAVGVHRDGDGGHAMGAVYVLFMKPEGTVRRFTKISPASGGLYTAGRSSFSSEMAYGETVAALPDVDGDGVPELMVGSQKHEVDILFLLPSGTVRDVVTLSRSCQCLPPDLHSWVPASVGTYWGASLAYLGDLDGNGAGEIAFAHPQNGDYAASAGAVMIAHLAPPRKWAVQLALEERPPSFNSAEAARSAGLSQGHLFSEPQDAGAAHIRVLS